MSFMHFITFLSYLPILEFQAAYFFFCWLLSDMLNIILPKPLFILTTNSLVYFCRNEIRPKNSTDQINTGLNM